MFSEIQNLFENLKNNMDDFKWEKIEPIKKDNNNNA